MSKKSFFLQETPHHRRGGYSLSKKYTNRLARKVQIQGNGTTARLCFGCPLLGGVIAALLEQPSNVVFALPWSR